MIRGRTLIALIGIGLFAAMPAGAADQRPPGVLVLPAKAIAATSATAEMLDPAAVVWNNVSASPLHLNRTPPLYAIGPADDGERPTASARALRLANGAAVVRIRWADATDDRARISAQYADAGAPHVYQRHSEGTGAFGDAVCVAIPRTRGPHATYPSMMMGDAAKPVEMYFWRAGEGFQRLDAHGRATPTVATAPVEGRFAREADGWAVTFVLPNMPRRTPLAFAIWNGGKQDRDGLKFYSLWHEIE